MLVAVQVALAVTLLAGAGLLFRSSFSSAKAASRPVSNAAHVLTFHISGSYGETADMKETRRNELDRTIDSLRSLPGVEAAATAAALPGVRSLVIKRKSRWLKGKSIQSAKS